MKTVTHSDEGNQLLLQIEDRQEKKGSYITKRGRFRNISAGATAIITQWPGHFAICWCNTFALIFGCLTLSLLLIFLGIQNGILSRPHCKTTSVMNFQNAPVYLIRYQYAWCQEQLRIVEQVAQNHPHCKIKMVIVDNSNDIRKNRAIFAPEIETSRKENAENDLEIESNFENQDSKTALDKNRIMKREKNFVQLLIQYPHIEVTVTTFEYIFANSPLFMTWHNLNSKMKFFAARVLFLWENAGVSYEIPQFVTRTGLSQVCINRKVNKFNREEMELLREIHQVENFIRNRNQSYSNTTTRLISIDDKGMYIETKSPCNAFLGEIITKLRLATSGIDPENILAVAMEKFCGKGGASSKFCKKI